MWYSLGLVSGSLLLATITYHIINNSVSSNQLFDNTEISRYSETLLTHPISYTQSQVILAQAAPATLNQGNEISINGRKFPVSWSQWNEGGSTRLGISDTGVMNILGLHLLSTQNPQVQPVHWFLSDPDQPLLLKAKFIAPYRYLDVTEVLQASGVQLQIVGNTLTLNTPQAQIQNIRQGNQNWGKRIVIELDRPTFWQVSQAKNEGTVTIEGVASPELIARFNSLPSILNSPNNTDEDDLGSGSNSKINTQSFSLETAQTTTKLSVNLPTAHGMRVFSLANPPRLVIDIRPDAQIEREIQWIPGIIWRQQLLSKNGDLYPITLLEIDLKSPNISLKPITTNPHTLEGTAPIVTTARNNQAIAAINGGFFNRDNKLPLGAIRIDNQWVSGPILNRGAIAWNNQGQVKLGRLRLVETITTSTGNRLPVLYLNSGYVQAGLARYTRQWEATYTPMSDNEIIITVQNDQVVEQQQGGKVGQNRFSIPEQGYLLIIRKNGAPVLNIGTQIKLESATIPPEFNNYPYILGAGPLLLQNGQIVLDAAAEQFSKGFQQQKASRSAIALTRQGKLIIVAAHNRVGGSGATLAEFAQILQALGAVDALNLDGGSSTSIALGGQIIDRSPVTAAKVHNGIGIFVHGGF